MKYINFSSCILKECNYSNYYSYIIKDKRMIYCTKYFNYRWVIVLLIILYFLWINFALLCRWTVQDSEILRTYIRFFTRLKVSLFAMKPWTNSSTTLCSARWIINDHRVLRAQLLHIQRNAKGVGHRAWHKYVI